MLFYFYVGHISMCCVRSIFARCVRYVLLVVMSCVHIWFVSCIFSILALICFSSCIKVFYSYFGLLFKFYFSLWDVGKMNEHYSQSTDADKPTTLGRYSARERAARNPRIFASGDLKLLLLELIGEHPRHGYDLIQQIEGLFDGAYSPSPGVIYPALAFLEAGKLVEVAIEGDKKNYSITGTGRLYLGQQAVALNGVHMRIEVSRRSLLGQERPAEIHEAMHNLRHALQLHQRYWSPVEIQRVHDLLNNTARAIVDGDG